MKKEINPAMAAVVVVILLAVVGYFVYSGTGGGGARDTKDNPMPKQASDQMKQMMEKFSKKGN